ncbi:DNA ligase [Colwelliaceae bacterium BS250]
MNLSTAFAKLLKLNVYSIVIFWLVLGSAAIAQQQHLTPNKSKPLLQHAKVYQGGVTISDYYVSEKLDGIRAYWDGHNLISRNGNIFSSPEWFTKQFGNIPLDGELWLARGQFQKTLSIVAKKHADDRWQSLKYMIFDLPTSSENFSGRVVQMQKLVSSNRSPYLAMIKQQNITEVGQLNELMDRVSSAGGEGLMLHKKSGFYQSGRSDNILKLKSFDDAEAVVIDHTAGKGKFSGLLGAVIVKTNSGKIFKIGSGFTQLQRQNPPAIGSIITYKYWGLTISGKPRFATFLRIRKDL